MFNNKKFWIAGFLSLILSASAGAATMEAAAEAIKKQEFEKAARMLTDLAKTGNREAQFFLAMMYEHGRGVPQNPSESFKWYKSAAEQGHDAAQNNLGQQYKNGKGTKVDLKEAVKWFRKAAEQGNAVAQYNLGVRLTKGEGVEKNLAEGVSWYTKAAEQGNMFGQFSLAYAYATGEGAEKNLPEAYAWAKASSTKEFVRAQQLVGFLESKMTPEELAAGEAKFQEIKTELKLPDPPAPAGPIGEQPQAESGAATAPAPN